MIRALIVAATPQEVAHCKPIQPAVNTGLPVGLHTISPHIDLLITGVGPLSCALAFSLVTRQAYSHIIGAGFVGSYSTRLAIGQVVVVCKECMPALGIWRDGQLITLQQARFAQYVPPQPDGYWQASSWYPPSTDAYPRLRGATVLAPTQGVATMGATPPADVESMEGAAFALACQSRGGDYISLRVISNYVAPQPEAAWDIPKAQIQLGSALERLLNNINAI